jgi:hypothetical protein
MEMRKIDLNCIWHLEMQPQRTTANSIPRICFPMSVQNLRADGQAPRKNELCYPESGRSETELEVGRESGDFLPPAASPSRSDVMSAYA